MAAIGNSNAEDFRWNRIAPNSAMAAIGAKFGGWGNARVNAARAKNIRIVVVRIFCSLPIIPVACRPVPANRRPNFAASSIRSSAWQLNPWLPGASNWATERCSDSLTPRDHP